MSRIDLLRHNLTEPIATTWAEPFHEEWLAGEGLPERVRFARALRAEMSAAEPVIRPGELIVGNNALVPIVSGFSTAFRYGVHLDEGRLAEVRERHPEAGGYLDSLEGYWRGWFAETGYRAPMQVHASLAYERFLEKGVSGVRAYVRECRARVGAGLAPPAGSDAWYEGLEITLDAISAFIGRHADAARKAARDESDTVRRAELLEIAQTCEAIREDPPATFRQAVQLSYLMFWTCGHDSPGPIDRYLGPALERDLDAGRTTLAEARELVECLWMKYEEKTAYGATLAGMAPDGSDATNRLTFLCLDAIERLRILSPRTAFRWSPVVSDAAVTRACEVIASGASLPAMVNDEVMIASMVERGIQLEHARDYSFVGCGQTYPHGRGHGSYEDVVLNGAKPIELALHDGLDPVSGVQVGPHTGVAESLSDWDSFEAAYRLQCDHMVTSAIEWVNAYRAEHRDRWFDLVRSLVTYSCLERGLDWHAGGADVSEGMVDMVGMTTATDSLYAIREAVFREGWLSLGELRDVLDRDFEGAEDLRLRLLRRIAKFGNADPDADGYAAREVARVNEHIRSHRTVFDGPWGLDIIGWSGAAEFGRVTGATPDGRKAGQPIADCAGPAQGRNILGPTATFESVLALPHATAHGPLVLSLRFPREAVAGAAGVARLRTLIEGYFARGGQQLQISIASTEEMREAQREPEKHRNLLVRVGGFSGYFVQLEKVFQDDMIQRSEMEP